MNRFTDEQLREIAGSFRIRGKITGVTPFGNGHINDTYKVVTDFPEMYILQRINHHVFKDIDGLMRNMALVLDHLKSKPGRMVWPELIADCRLPTADCRLRTTD